MKIEILYPEMCCLYGDKANVTFLRKSLNDCVFYETSINEKPKFLTEKIDLIYMCSMTESNQEKIVNELMKYKKEINKLVEDGVIFILVGNSFEIFTSYIKNTDGKKIECLDILDGMYSERILPKRKNSLILGEFNNEKIVGYTSRFSDSYGEDKYGTGPIIKGLGMNDDSKYVFVRKNNLFGTYLLGPLLVSNPNFTKYIMNLLGIENPTLYCEEECFLAYDKRVSELKKNIRF